MRACAVASPESSLHVVAPSLLDFTGKQIAASQVVRELGEGRIRAETEEGEEGAATLEVISPRRVRVPAGGQALETREAKMSILLKAVGLLFLGMLQAFPKVRE